MNTLRPQHLAWLLWAISIGVGVGTILVERDLIPSPGSLTVTQLVAEAVAFTAMATVGAFVASKRPEYPIGWLVLSFPFFGAFAEAAQLYARYAIHIEPGALPGGAIAALLAVSMWTLAYGLLIFIPLLFPRGTLLTPRWGWAAWGLGAATGTLIVASFFSPQVDVQIGTPVNNPLAIASAEPILAAVLAVAEVAFVLLWAVAGVSLVLRYARSSGDERQQMKWFAYTATIFAVFMVGVVAWSPLIGREIPDAWANILVPAMLVFLTLGLAIAILNHRLYDIDQIINRTLVYGLLTASLGTVFVGSVIGLQAVFRVLTGQGSPLAVVISTLIIAAPSMSLRRRIQVLIDQRFFRHRYNATQTVAAFGARMRDDVDMDRITGDLVAVVEEAMQPAHASLWLRGRPSPGR